MKQRKNKSKFFSRGPYALAKPYTSVKQRVYAVRLLGVDLYLETDYV